MAGVNVSVRSSLGKIIQDLEKIRAASDGVQNSFTKMGDDAAKNIRGNTKKTETYFGGIGRYGQRIADQLRRDFKSLFALNAVTDALKISNQFRGAIAQTVELSDEIRRLGPVFGIVSGRFVQFQTKMAQGLGEIGLASDVAARALQGLSETRVRGEDNLVNYAKNSGMLTSVGGEKGQEGAVARLLAGVTQARGGDVNDKATTDRLSESVRKVFNATGSSPTKILGDMQSLFEAMPDDLRKSIDDSAVADLATVSAAGGPGSTEFLKKYLSLSKTERIPYDAQGGGGMFGKKGFNVEAFRRFYQSITSRVGGDKTLGAKTLGLGDDEAKGFVRLGERLDDVNAAQERLRASTGDLGTQFDETRSFADAFSANIARISRLLSKPIAYATQVGTSAMVGASKSDAGAAAVTGGAAAVAAILAGIGLGGIFGKGGGPAGKILGQAALPVRVVNFNEMGIAGGAATAAGGVASGASKTMSTLGKVTLIAAGGVAVYSALDALIGSKPQDNEPFNPKASMDYLEAAFYELSEIFGGSTAKDVEDRNRHIYEYDKATDKPVDPAKFYHPDADKPDVEEYIGAKLPSGRGPNGEFRNSIHDDVFSSEMAFFLRKMNQAAAQGNPTAISNLQELGIKPPEVNVRITVENKSQSKLKVTAQKPKVGAAH